MRRLVSNVSGSIRQEVDICRVATICAGLVRRRNYCYIGLNWTPSQLASVFTKGNLRVLNPITSNMVELNGFVKTGLTLLANADRVVQPSVPWEVGRAVKLVFGTLEAAIKESLHSTLLDKQEKLLELLWLFAFLVKLLNSSLHVDTLRAVMCEVAEEYDLSKQRMLNVVDSDGNWASLLRMGRFQDDACSGNARTWRWIRLGDRFLFSSSCRVRSSLL